MPAGNVEGTAPPAWDAMAFRIRGAITMPAVYATAIGSASMSAELLLATTAAAAVLAATETSAAGWWKTCAGSVTESAAAAWTFAECQTETRLPVMDAMGSLQAGWYSTCVGGAVGRTSLA